MLKTLNWKLWLRVVISLGLIILFLMIFKWRQIVVILQNVQLQWLIVALIWIIVAVLVSTLKWKFILHAQGLKLKFRELWHIYWVGLFFNNFLPSSIGGDALRILWVGRATQDHPGATASVVIERILATTGLALVGLLGCLVVPKPRREVIILFFALLVFTLFLMGLLMSERLSSLILKRQNRFTQFIAEISYHGQNIRKSPKTIVGVLLWSVVFQVCVVGTNYAIFCSLNLETMNWIKSLYVVPATSAAAMLPLGINGYGIREGAYIILLQPYNVTETAAFTASLLFAFLVSACSLWGGWVWLLSRKDS